VRVASRTAHRQSGDRAMEGGFMGFHAERVSKQRMLDKLAEVLSAN
jgi:hypothetical protein